MCPRGKRHEINPETGEDESIGLVLGDGKYRLATDRLNVILQERMVVTGNSRGRQTKKENIGKIRYSNIAYVSDPHYALIYILKHELLKTGLKDLETISKRYDEIEAMIKAIPDSALPQMGSK